MRELGDRVGMRAQSLYSYFASKLEIFDAMFLEGNEDLLGTMRIALDAMEDGEDPIAACVTVADTFVLFCTSDPIRYQLLFQRTIPGFVPSERSYAVAQEAYELSVGPLRALGIDGPQLDMCTAVMAGLVAQQISNNPGGDRWVRLTQPAASMLMRELVPDLLSHTHSKRSAT